jgi:hypothetical protein
MQHKKVKNWKVELGSSLWQRVWLLALVDEKVLQNTVHISRKGIQTVRSAHLIRLVMLEAQSTQNFQEI